MSATDPIHAVGSIRAYARLTEIDRLREHHDDLFREDGRVTAEQLRHVRHHAENLLYDLDRLIADIEDVSAEEVRLRHDSEAIAAMVAVVLRRHGEAVARMALAAVQDLPAPAAAVPAASVDGEAPTRREERPAPDSVPAVEPPAPSVQAPAPAVAVAADPASTQMTTDEAMAAMADVERTDLPAFDRRSPTRRTTDLTPDEEMETARSHPMGRPGSRPRRASSPPIDDELFGDMPDPPAPTAPSPALPVPSWSTFPNGTEFGTNRILDLAGPVFDAIRSAAAARNMNYHDWAVGLWRAWVDGGGVIVPRSMESYPPGPHRIAFYVPLSLDRRMDDLTRRMPWSRQAIERALMLDALPEFPHLAYRRNRQRRPLR